MRDLLVSAEERYAAFASQCPNGKEHHVTVAECSICGFLEWMSTKLDTPVGYTVQPRTGWDSPCPRCVAVAARAPEVYEWVLSVAGNVLRQAAPAVRTPDTTSGCPRCGAALGDCVATLEACRGALPDWSAMQRYVADSLSLARAALAGTIGDTNADTGADRAPEPADDGLRELLKEARYWLDRGPHPSGLLSRIDAALARLTVQPPAPPADPYEYRKALFLAEVIENDPQSKAHHNAAASCLRRQHAKIEQLKSEIESALNEAALRDCEHGADKPPSTTDAQR